MISNRHLRLSCLSQIPRLAHTIGRQPEGIDIGYVDGTGLEISVLEADRNHKR
jgi:hypothetical protein